MRFLTQSIAARSPFLSAAAATSSSSCLLFRSPPSSGNLFRSSPHASIPSLGLRFASKMTEQRGRPVLVHVLDPYIPGKEASPPFLTKAWRSHVTRKVISPVRFWFAKRKVKRLITGWTPAAFAEEAQTLYADMNVAFAKGDKETLSDVVTDSLLAKLMTEMKQTQKLGRVQWKSHGVASPTKMVHMVVGKAQLERNGTEFSVAQATVRINMKQSVAIFDQRGRIVGGDPNVVKDIVEHVVLERWLDRPDVPHVWKIAARLGVAPTPSPPSTS